jgi:hypothetical protein
VLLLLLPLLPAVTAAFPCCLLLHRLLPCVFLPELFQLLVLLLLLPLLPAVTAAAPCSAA